MAHHHDLVQQAGAIVFRGRNADTQVLLVTAKHDPAAWIFPKGHIEHNETPAETAQREALEEAGVSGRVIGSAGTSIFEVDDKTFQVEYFILAFERQEPSDEGRQIRWVTPEEAERLLTHANARTILRTALESLQGHP